MISSGNVAVESAATLLAVAAEGEAAGAAASCWTKSASAATRTSFRLSSRSAVISPSKTMLLWYAVVIGSRETMKELRSSMGDPTSLSALSLSFTLTKPQFFSAFGSAFSSSPIVELLSWSSTSLSGCLSQFPNRGPNRLFSPSSSKSLSDNSWRSLGTSSSSRRLKRIPRSASTSWVTSSSAYSTLLTLALTARLLEAWGEEKWESFNSMLPALIFSCFSSWSNNSCRDDGKGTVLLSRLVLIKLLSVSPLIWFAIGLVWSLEDLLFLRLSFFDLSVLPSPTSESSRCSLSCERTLCSSASGELLSLTFASLSHSSKIRLFSVVIGSSDLSPSSTSWGFSAIEYRLRAFTLLIGV